MTTDGREKRQAANADAVALAAAALKKTLAAIEAYRREAQSPDTDPGYADREAMGKSAATILEFCRQLHMEIGSLGRLNVLLLKAHTSGVATDLQGPSLGHRPPDTPNVQGAKGALAGIVAARRVLRGETKAAASGWVAEHIPAGLARTLSPQPITAAIVSEWFARYAGRYGEPGMARERFETVVTLARQLRPTDLQFKAMIRALGPLSQKPSG